MPPVARWLTTAKPPTPLAVSLAIILLHGAFLLWTGVRFAPDSRAYAYWSGRLVESRFDYAGLLAEANHNFPPILYALFVSVIALLRSVFGDGWSVALVILNLAAHTVLGVLLVTLVFRTSRCGAAAWLALFLFLGSHDLVRWMPFILSDTTFALLAFSVFALTAASIAGRQKRWVPAGLLAAACTFYRPTGGVLLLCVTGTAVLSRRLSSKFRTGAAAAFLGAAIAVTLLFAWFMQDPGRWPIRPLSDAFETVAAGYASGEVVRDRTETYHLPPNSLPELMLITADRFVHFFAPVAGDYSTIHKLVSLTFFVPCYLLAGWLGLSLLLSETPITSGQRAVYLAAIGWIVVFAFFHALVQVDFDWRYRVPVLPLMILLAGGGAADLIRRGSR